MRWQKTARLAIAIVVIAFAAVVFVALRREAPPAVRETSPRKDPGTVAETLGASTLKRTAPDGKLLFSLAFEGQLTYPDGRNVLTNATLTLPDRGGRTITVTGTEMEVASSKGGSGQIGTAKMSRGVTLKTDDGLEVKSDQATYDENSRILTVPGEVQFTKGRLTGSGVGATYDQNRDVLWLLDRAKVTVAADEKGGGAIDATAGAAGLARAEHYLRLTKNAHVVGEGRTLDADDLTVQLTPDDRLIQTMALRGNSRITGTPGGSGPEGMSARDIDLTYGPDGRTLQQAKLMENAVAQLPGGAGAGSRRISGRTIDISLGPDGSTVTSLQAIENVQVDIPATANAPARRINAQSLAAGGASGLQTATFTGGVRFRETRAAQRGAPAGERTADSVRLVIETQPGLGEIQQADFRGNVRIVDGETTAEGPQAIYRVAQDSFDVVPGTGDPGPPPSVNDGKVLVNARTITIAIATKKLRAETDVRSSMQPSPRTDKSPGPSKGRAGNGSNDTKMPSVFKQDEVINATSNRLEYDGAAARATYTGNAKLFQGQTRIQADAITVDDRTANLNASGKVVTVMFLEEVDSKTKASQLVQTTATGDTMVYEDAKRLATYKTGPSANAHLVGTQGDVTGDQIQLFLKQGVNELERAEADGHVTVKEGYRTATGNHLTYTAADETYVMNGTPVEIEEKTPTECRVTTTSQVTFMRSAVSTTIRNNGVSPNATRPCVAR